MTENVEYIVHFCLQINKAECTVVLKVLYKRNQCS